MENKDKSTIAKTFMELESYDLGDDFSVDDRVKFFHRCLSEAWRDEYNKDKKATARFALDAMDSSIPEPLHEVAKDLRGEWDYEDAKAEATALSKQVQDLADFPLGIDMQDIACSVVRASSTNDDWDTSCMMGAHPGIYYGAHTAATHEAWPTYSMWGAQSPEDPDNYIPQRIFDAMYPKAHGML